jgi:hypothetical protein
MLLDQAERALPTLLATLPQRGGQSRRSSHPPEV